ncbi:MAG TPA: YcnI family protein [Burkholderiaceae bacterium]
MAFSFSPRASLLATAMLVATSASAHITLEQREAEAGSYYKAVLRVGHGCEGAPVRAITVRLPAGFRGAKPMPKPGWTLTIRRQPLATPYDSHGRTVKDDVTEIRWEAGSQSAWLPDAHYDEFVLRGQLPAAAGPLWFKVLQTCAKGQIDWAELPASGTSTQGLKAPAALLQVTPAAPGHAHH